MPFIFRNVVVESIGIIVDWIKGGPERKRRERQRKRNDSLEGRIEGWEGNLRSGLDEVRAAVAGEVEALREEQAKAMRHVERRLVRLEAGRSEQDGMERTSPTGAEPEPSKRRYVRPLGDKEKIMHVIALLFGDLSCLRQQFKPGQGVEQSSIEDCQMVLIGAIQTP